MKPADKIKQLINNSDVRTDSPIDKRILADALEHLEKLKQQKSAETQSNIWRTIMKSRITKLTTAAAVILIVIFGLNLLDKSTTPIWAIEQTVKAMEKINTLIISGNDRYGSETIPFKFLIKFPDKDGASLDMRYECSKQIVVVKGTRAWAYYADENIVKVYENVKNSSGMMRDLRFWYKITDLNPWITGKLLATLKSFADDWQETYGKYERTGQDCVFVNCSYKALSISFWFVCDLENKLIIEGKYWRNVDRHGQPECHAVSFTYNKKIDDEIFDFKVPNGAKVIYREQQKQAADLFARGEKLFHNKKQPAQAIEVYQQVYEKYPELNVAEEALMMIGLCYERMGNYEKAIEFYEKAIKEYPNLKGWTEATYFYLGCAYIETEQREKALEAFKNCLIIGEGIREPDKFPLKHAREYIENLKNEK